MEMRDAFFKALYDRASADRDIIVLTGDQGAFWLDKIAKDMPEQFLNCGIAEQNMISVAAGLALTGRKPFIHGINNFLVLRALEQISVDIVSMKLPVVLIGVGAGYTYSTDGPTHHGVCDLGAALSVGMSVYNCSDEHNSEYFARNVQGPAYIRIEKGVLPKLPLVTKFFSDSMNLRRAGNPMRIASGYMVHEAMKLQGGVLDIQKFPIDERRLREILMNNSKVRVLEDNNGGPIAAAVAQVIMKDLPGAIFKSIAPKEFIFEYGSRDFLHQKAGLTEETNVAIAIAR